MIPYDIRITYNNGCTRPILDVGEGESIDSNFDHKVIVSIL